MNNLRSLQRISLHQLAAHLARLTCSKVPACSFCSKNPDQPEKVVFNPKKILVLAKVTKYDFERSLENDENDEHVLHALIRRGVNVDWLVTRHNAHYRKLTELLRILRLRGYEVQMVDRNDFTADSVTWADVVFTAGGDGTFLLGASKVRNRTKLVIGLNTDPEFSEGYLCLPKSCTWNLPKALDSLQTGNFKPFWRQRLRVTLLHQRNRPPKMDLLDKRKPVATDGWPERRSEILDPSPDEMREGKTPRDIFSLVPPGLRDEMMVTVLPVCALNEIYIGEALSARVSQYEMSVDGTKSVRQKSSGIVISTGTGSTSWYRQIMYQTPRTIADILDLANEIQSNEKIAEVQEAVQMHGSNLPLVDQGLSYPSVADLAQKIAQRYNSSLRFAPEDNRMAYVVRDPLHNAVYCISKPWGFAFNLQIRSLMLDAHLAFDGGCTFPFSYGSVAEFNINPSDALCCVRMSKWS
ncbi:unnamed protein product [Calicophoron daubneyi]|uniref:NAD(+) kinase n=1 Tax=Calicophoron daubneyi TaxID=300641 RepID=A0AAV2TAF6_CALDB